MKQRDLGRAQRRGRREAGAAAVGGKEGEGRRGDEEEELDRGRATLADRWAPRSGGTVVVA